LHKLKLLLQAHLDLKHFLHDLLLHLLLIFALAQLLCILLQLFQLLLCLLLQLLDLGLSLRLDLLCLLLNLLLQLFHLFIYLLLELFHLPLLGGLCRLLCLYERNDNKCGDDPAADLFYCFHLFFVRDYSADAALFY